MVKSHSREIEEDSIQLLVEEEDQEALTTCKTMEPLVFLRFMVVSQDEVHPLLRARDTKQ
jgi:hypothetical protein